MIRTPCKFLATASLLLVAWPVVPGVADGFTDDQPMEATMATLLESAPLLNEPFISEPAPVLEPAPGPDPSTTVESPAEPERFTAPEAAVIEPASAPKPQPGPEVVEVMTGKASWYGPGFYGNRTASGEVFRRGTVTAAHRTLPFGSRVRVTNLWNGRSTVVRINDRGPFTDACVIDLAHGAATELGLVSSGIADVKLEVLR